LLDEFIQSGSEPPLLSAPGEPPLLPPPDDPTER
jgi:hypothetical protein